MVPSPDPQHLNRYSYTRNNPTSRIDPTGHDDVAVLQGYLTLLESSPTLAQTLGILAAIQSMANSNANARPIPSGYGGQPSGQPRDQRPPTPTPTPPPPPIPGPVQPGSNTVTPPPTAPTPNNSSQLNQIVTSTGRAPGPPGWDYSNAQPTTTIQADQWSNFINGLSVGLEVYSNEVSVDQHILMVGMLGSYGVAAACATVALCPAAIFVGGVVVGSTILVYVLPNVGSATQFVSQANSAGRGFVSTLWNNFVQGTASMACPSCNR